MSEIKIHEQSLPTRCEICHQADAFDAITNTCARCTDILSVVQSRAAHKRPPAGKVEESTYTIIVGTIVGLSLLAFLISLGIFIWWPAFMSFWAVVGISPLQFSVGAMVLTAIILARILKMLILQQVPHTGRLTPTTAAAYPELDRSRFESYTRDLESLGFTRVQDYTLTDDAGKTKPNFSRLFFNHKQNCEVELFQFFPAPGKPGTVTCTLNSHFEENWHLSTTNLRPDPSNYIIRAPQRLSICLVDANARDLLAKHRFWCEQISQDLGCKVLPCGSWQDYTARSLQTQKDGYHRVKKMNMLKALIEGAIFEQWPRKDLYMWLGKYKKTRRRKA